MNTHLRLGTTLLAVALLGLSSVSNAEGEPKPTVEVSVGEKGLRVKTSDNQFKFKAGGRLHFDGAGHVGDLPLWDDDGTIEEAGPNDGADVRRGRIYLGATAYEDWDFFINVDFADNDVAIKDALISWNRLDWLRLTVGSQKQPYSLDIEMSSNDIPFVERGADYYLLAPFVDRALGFRADAWGEHWMTAVGVYADGVDRNSELADGWGTAWRGIVTPVKRDDAIVHLGMRVAYREPAESDQKYRIRSETTNFSNLFIVDTGDSQNDIDNIVLYGPEMALAWGPVSFWGEYNQAVIDRPGLDKLKFQSGYAAVAWTITGESRAASYKMKDGEFKRLRPARPFTLRGGGGTGAWEVAFRYAHLDTNYRDVRGGMEGRISTALNWMPNYNVRFMFDWTRVVNTKEGNITTQTARGLDILTGRVQIAF